MESKLVRLWATGNTADEISYTGDMRKLRDSVIHCNNCVANGDSQYSTDPKYWRGLVALAIADPDEKAQKGHSRRFIEWASGRDDLALVITTAKERDTIVPEALEAILDQDLAAPLQRGAL